LLEGEERWGRRKDEERREVEGEREERESE
jgi:hypothetical protein